MTRDLVLVMLEEILRGTPLPLRWPWRLSPDHVALVRDANRSAQKLRRLTNPDARKSHVVGMRVLRIAKAGRGLCKDCPGVVAIRANGRQSSRCKPCLEKHRVACCAALRRRNQMVAT